MNDYEELTTLEELNAMELGETLSVGIVTDDTFQKDKEFVKMGKERWCSADIKERRLSYYTNDNLIHYLKSVAHRIGYPERLSLEIITTHRPTISHRVLCT